MKLAAFISAVAAGISLTGSVMTFFRGDVAATVLALAIGVIALGLCIWCGQ